jgi:hypothetical protein
MARVVQRQAVMLPSSKRPPRAHDPSEVIRTGDYEVVDASSPSSKRRANVTERPRFSAAPLEVDDEDRTLLFKGSTRSMLPPRPQTPVPMPVIAKPSKAPSTRALVRGSDRPPSPQTLRGGSERPPGPESLRGGPRGRLDKEDRTILRPTSTLPPQLQRMAQTAPPKPASARPPAMMPTPYVPMKPMDPGTTAPPVSINAPGGTDSRDSEPPSSVITARTRILRGKSSTSWAIGLMAIGAIVGLATAIVAHGDADAVLDAAATFVDPAHPTVAHANGAAAQAAVLPSFVETKHAVPVGTDQNPAPGACLDAPPLPPPTTLSVSTPVVINAPPPARAAETRTASLAGADPAAAAHVAPPKPAPIAFAAPAKAAPAPARTWTPPRETPQSSGWLANVTPPGAGAPMARPSKATAAPPKAAGDFESAAAADALAKAQLEASLR